MQAVTGASVEVAFVDQGYTGAAPASDAAAEGVRLEVVKLPEAKRGFVLLPRRWVVERSFAWMRRFRRLAKDYERLPDTVAGLHFLAFARLMLSRVVYLFLGRSQQALVSSFVLLVGIGGCGPATFSPAEQTANMMHLVFAGVARYRDSVGVLPNQLADVCQVNRRWCRADSTGSARDGWGQPLEYTATDTGYVLRSLGADTMPNTGDEISFSSAQEERLVRELTGCYRFVRAPPGVSAERFVLDTVRAEPAEYRLLPTMGYRRAVWYPVPPQGVWLEWSTTPSGLLIQLEVSGDSLVGTGTAGSDFAAPRRGQVVARRAGCP